MAEGNMAFRAARYFGFDREPRSTIHYHDGIARCVAVIPRDSGRKALMVGLYREYPVTDGWVLKLTAKQLEQFKAVIDG